MGDIVALAAEIDREREARENAAAQERGASPLGGAPHDNNGSRQGAVGTTLEASAAKDADGDVKVEG